MKNICKNKMINSENELTEVIIDYLKSMDYNVRKEVPNMGQSADLAATKGRWVTLIEAKLYNWKRAMEQCQAHESVADYIYIGIASVNISDDFYSGANKRGYGIIHCDPYTNVCRIILKAKRNTKIWNPQRQFFTAMIKDIEYAY